MASSKRTFYPNPQVGLTASRDNDAAEAQTNAYNMAAATQYQSMRRAGTVDPMDTNASGTEAASQAARVALAKALGYKDMNNLPTMGALMGKYYSTPEIVQAKIYKAGAAQFVAPEDGSRMIQSIADNQQKALDAHTNELATGLANGKVNYDLDKSGNPSFYTMEGDPDNPGMPKKKTPLNKLQVALIQRGFENGTIPNIFSPDAQNGSVAAPAPKMSTDDFQKVLDARAAGTAPQDDVARFQQVLNDRANGTNLSGYKPPVATSGDMQGPPMPAPMQGPPMPPPAQVPTAIRARDAVGNFVDNTVPNFMQNAGSAVAQTYLTDLPNAVSKGVDWLRQFATGSAPRDASADFDPQFVPSSPMTSVMAADDVRKRQALDTSDLSNY